MTLRETPPRRAGTAYAIAATLASAATAVAATAGPATIDLGLIDGDAEFALNLAPDEVLFLTFTLTQPVTGDAFLDITTNGSVTVDGLDADTELALFDDSGTLIAVDDDAGTGLNSVLSFGVGSGLALGDGSPFDDLGGDGIAQGENGPLAAGAFVLAVGEFDTAFGGTGFAATPPSFAFGGPVTLSIITNVPSPASASAAALVVLILTARRR